jgi:hypothetical protein
MDSSAVDEAILPYDRSPPVSESLTRSSRLGKVAASHLKGIPASVRRATRDHRVMISPDEVPVSSAEAERSRSGRWSTNSDGHCRMRPSCSVHRFRGRRT